MRSMPQLPHQKCCLDQAAGWAQGEVVELIELNISHVQRGIMLYTARYARRWLRWLGAVGLGCAAGFWNLHANKDRVVMVVGSHDFSSIAAVMVGVVSFVGPACLIGFLIWQMTRMQPKTAALLAGKWFQRMNVPADGILLLRMASDAIQDSRDDRVLMRREEVAEVISDGEVTVFVAAEPKRWVIVSGDQRAWKERGLDVGRHSAAGLHER